MPKTPLIPIPLITPGFFGLNYAQAASTQLGPEWATTCVNTYFDLNGRLAARKGWTLQNATPITGSPKVEQIFEYVTAAGGSTVISAANLKLYAGATSPTDVTGSIIPTDNNWQFQNWNDKVVGWQSGNAPIVYTGTGSFTAIAAASGSVPLGNAVCAAFGRLWAVDADNNTIKYCGLLDETNWGNAGSGNIQMRDIWTRGTDKVVGIAAVGANLVVFGQKHIVLFADGTGSVLGLDPAQMYVADTIEGTGLLSRDTVAPEGTGDLLYVSPTGLQSLGRTIQSKSNPTSSLDLHVWDYIYSLYSSEPNQAKVRAAYSPVDKFYLLILPSTGEVFCYDTRRPITGSKNVADGSLRVTEWTSIAPKCAMCTQGGLSLYMGFAGGNIGQQGGTVYQDNGASFPLSYVSPNLSFGASDPETSLENRLKIPKRLQSIIFTTAANTLTFSWGFDFQGMQFSNTQTVAGSRIPEYGTAEWGTNGVYNVTDLTAIPGVNYSEYAGTVILKTLILPMFGTGRWIQAGLSATINGSSFALQEFDIYLKPGAMR